MSNTSTVKLSTSDGEELEVELKVVKCFGLVRTMLENLGTEEGEIVPLPNVSSSVLKKVIEWARHHADDLAKTEDVNKDSKRNNDVSPWDKKFMQVDQEMIYEIILAANYLDIEELIVLCEKTVANMMKGKTPDQIRATFGIQISPSDDVNSDYVNNDDLGLD